MPDQMQGSKKNAAAVAIVGASLAGASLALRLQKAGINCLLFDAADFPRRKVCGEGLSVLALKELGELGLESRIANLPQVSFSGFRFVHQQHLKSERSGLDLGLAHGFGIQRYLLDNLLVNEFKNLNPDALLLGVKPTIRELSDGTFEIVRAGSSWRAKYLVLATGGQSRLPQELGVPTRENSSGRSGLSVPLQLASKLREPTVAIYVSADLQACFTPTSEYSMNISYMSSGPKIPDLSAGGIEQLVRQSCARVGIDGEISGPPLGCANIGRFERAALTRNIFVIGDALSQLDPIGGMGMTQALYCSRVTAETLYPLVHYQHHLGELTRRTHARRMARVLRRLRAYTRLSYLSLAHEQGRATFGRLKTSDVARNIMLSMQPDCGRAGSRFAPQVLSSLIITLAGII